MKGQSLLEVLVSLSLGTIFLTSSIVLLSIILKAQTNLNFQSEFYSLVKDYSDLIFYSSKNQWPSLYSLERNTPYKISFTGNVFSYTQGVEDSQIKNTPYHLYFKVFDVYRDINGNISETGDLDPSTLKIVIYFDYGPEYQTSFNFSFYVTRSYLNQVFTQTDWSGGGSEEGPVYDPSNKFSSSDNISYSTELALATTTSSGFLISSILDSGVVQGVNFNSLIWQGTLCSGCQVKIQLASSNSSDGPWNYYGPLSQDDYYTPLPGEPVILPFTGLSAHQNKKYIRYKIELVPSNDQSPVVESISINYSK